MKQFLFLAAFFVTALAASAQGTTNITGCTRFWKNNAPVMGAQLSTPGIQFPSLPGPNMGTYGFPFDSAQSCSEGIFQNAWINPSIPIFIIADKIDNPRNGLSVLDLLLIAKYKAGTEPWPSPYAYFAADANRSGSISSFDIVELRKLLLGIYTELPNAPEWNIMPEYIQFANPSNPFQIVPESYSLSAEEFQAYDNDTLTMIATKIGDLDGDANLLGGPYQAPMGTDSLSILLPDMMLSADELLIIPVGLEVPAQIIHGVQFRLNFKVQGLQVLDIIPSDYVTHHNFGVFGDGLGVVIERVSGIPVVAGEPLFRFVAKWQPQTPTALKDVLEISQTFLPPLAVSCSDSTPKVYRLGQQFLPTSAAHSPSANTLRATPAMPNPFTHKAFVKIELSEATPVLLEVFDLDSRLRWSSEQVLGAGVQQLEIPAEAVEPGSMGLYRVRAGASVATGKAFRH